MQFDFRDGGADLQLSVSECATGWSLKGPKGKQQQTVPFEEIWGGSGTGSSVNYRYSCFARNLSVYNMAFVKRLISINYCIRIK